MTIDFTCQKCDTSFELDAQDMIDGTEKLACPHCRAKAPPGLMDDFISALSEMRTQVAALSKKFAINMALETEDLEDELPSKEEDEDLDFEEDEDDVEEDEEEEVEDEDTEER
jgi:hypothetical protein